MHFFIIHVRRTQNLNLIFSLGIINWHILLFKYNEKEDYCVKI